ncbi:protein kinase-like domain, Concanavalin A-like lectin/glucanase domain protein [Artemisia annua]|uniref:non-specific serine/threonine protein kinase n=1 Tax=Artemisia annua TaxID=35608 RepID=A0A2U1L2B2_ARTAN|nr:protein kinase-like domain, Concanavalin A-like lectin/glucanase domain protein [Artemisia annua]
MKPSTHLTSIITIITITTFLTTPTNSHPRNTSFFFQTLPSQNLTFRGDSFLRNSIATLTRDSDTPISSSGTLVLNTPIRFSDNRTNSTTSFVTNFTFVVKPGKPVSGGGVAFFLSPENDTLGSPDGFLGLVNASELTKNKFVAVEYDTRLDPHFSDPNDNHVGLDIDSLDSVATVDLSTVGIDLKKGGKFSSWVEYYHDLRCLKVYLSRDPIRPENPVLNTSVDLSSYFQEFMYMGFSGSSQGSTEAHMVESWGFRSFGLKRFNPRDPYNVSDHTVEIRVRDRNSSYRKYSKKIGFGFEIGGPVFVFAGLVLFGYVSVKKWREIKNDTVIKNEFKRKPRQYRYRELKIATNDFHPSRVIGHGSFGTVYKAFLVSSGMTAAVKRSKQSSEAKNEFLSELSVIAGLRHKNLVQLLGWCVEKGELLLVYELMPYGSIDKVLYQDPDHWGFLKWSHRYKIATGLASVLAYLHQECDKLVIHCDIKSSNVMLDANFNARLGDFGLAKLIDHDKSPISTLTAGTAGYLAPEYLHCGKANDKTDVYSYGVVVLEICCGRRPIVKEPESQNMVNLVDWVWGLYSSGKVLDSIDARLNGVFDEVEGERLLMVGLSCVNPLSEMRPSMRRVLQILNNEAEVMNVPVVKPKVSFSASMPMSVKDLVSCSDDETESMIDSSKTSSDSGFEIRIERSTD